MIITIDITPNSETALRRQAERNGLTLNLYMRRVVEQLADEENAADEAPTNATNSAPKTDMPRKRHLLTKRPRRPYNPAGLVAALESFEQGDAEEQRQTLKYLETALDRDRPGQRRIFGPGINPMPTDEAA